MVYKELYLHESWADKQGECSHRYVPLGAWNINYATLSKNSQSLLHVSGDRHWLQTLTGEITIVIVLCKT